MLYLMVFLRLYMPILFIKLLRNFFFHLNIVLLYYALQFIREP